MLSCAADLEAVMLSQPGMTVQPLLVPAGELVPILHHAWVESHAETPARHLLLQ